MTTDEPRKSPPRITMQHIFTQVLESFNFERGLLHTIKVLALRPERAMQHYLFTDRTRLMRPLSFLLLTTAVFVFLTLQFLPTNSNTVDLPFDHPFVAELEQNLQYIANKVVEYLNAVLILTIPLTSLATYWVFPGKRLYYAEHLVLNAYIYGFSNLILLLLLPLFVMDDNLASLAFLTNLYSAYVYIRFFEEKIVSGILKTIVVLVLAQLLTLVILLLAVVLVTLF